MRLKEIPAATRNASRRVAAPIAWLSAGCVTAREAPAAHDSVGDESSRWFHGENSMGGGLADVDTGAGVCWGGNIAAGEASVCRDASVHFDTGAARRTADGQAFIRRSQSEPQAGGQREPGAETAFP